NAVHFQDKAEETRAQDSIEQFINEGYLRLPSAIESAGELATARTFTLSDAYRGYVDFCEDAGIKSKHSKFVFAKILPQRFGVKRVRAPHPKYSNRFLRDNAV